MSGDAAGVHAPAEDALARVADALRRARRVLVVTGAGVSADSGLPTYRGVGGLYEGAGTDAGIPIEVALSGAMLRTHPEVSWKYIYEIENACRGARPNDAHRVIAALQHEVPWLGVLTQNVDGFHDAAGSRELVEIHGRIHQLCCTACDWTRRVPDYAELDIPPRCPSCDAIVRPDVVLFGEILPSRAIATLGRWEAEPADVVLSVGTTSAFEYIAGPVIEARRRGALTVEINPGRSEVSGLVDVRIAAGAADTLRALWDALGYSVAAIEGGT